MKFITGIVSAILLPIFLQAQCPVINTAMINACAQAPSTSEGINEFVYFTTTSPATAGDYTLSYGVANPPLGGPTSNTLSGANATAQNGTGSLVTSNGCTITLVTSPATVIPANSGVILIPSNFDNTYDLSGICTGTTLYAILVDITAAPSNTWGPGGTFANASGASPRYLQVSNAAINCSSNIVTYNGNGWSANTDGNSVWWNGASTSYQNNGCNIIKPPKPTITPGAIAAVCEHSTSVNLPYTTTGNPNQYSIDWDNAANTAGITDINAATLVASPLSISVPANLAPGTYNGSLTAINSLTPDTSLPQAVSFTINAAPVVTAQPSTTVQNVCQNGPVNTLSVTATPGSGSITGYQWYITTNNNNTSGAAIPFATSSTYTPSSASLGTIYFYCKITNSNGCVTTSDVSGALIVSPNIATPTASATQQPTCAAPTGTITVTAPAGANIQYSIDGTNYQASGIFSSLSPGLTYSITAKNIVTGCTSPVKTVTINSLPASPAVTASVTVQPTCATPTGTIVISAPIGADYEYSIGGAYQSSTLFSGLTNSTTYNVTVRQISTGCVSTALPLTVNPVSGAPARADISVVQPDCSTPTGTITITAPLNANYEYSVGGGYQAGASFTGLAPGGSFSVTVKDLITGCVSAPHDTTLQVIPVLAPPTITTPIITYCQNAGATVLTAIGSNLQWYSTLTGGVASTTAPTPVTTAAGTFKFYVSQKSGICESARDSITVTVNPTPALPGTAGNTTNYCQNAPTSVLTATGSNLQWYTVASGGTALPGAPSPSTATAGTFTFYVSQTINGCESGRAPINITINSTPSAPSVSGNKTTYCKNETAVAIIPNGAAYLWYTTPVGGTGSATPPQAQVSVAGTNTYYVSQSVNGCESARTPLTITVNDIPTAPSVVSPVGYCEAAAASPLSATGSSLLWYTAPPPGTGSSTAPTPSTATAGNTSYYVTQTANGCESPAATIMVTVGPAPSLPVTAPVTYCQDAFANVLTATGSNLLWYDNSTGGIGSPVAPIPSTVSPGPLSYYVSQTVNGCESGRATLTVTVNPTPAPPAVANPNLQFCHNSTPGTLSATGTNLIWYTQPAGGTGSATPPALSTSTTGSSFYYVTQTVNGCESGTSLITVTVVAVATPPVVTTPVEYCQNQTAVALTANGVGLQWYTSLSSTSVLPSAPVPSTTVTGSVKYYVSQFINGCESKRDSITVVTKPMSQPPVVNSPLEYCQNTIAPQLTATGTNLLWYAAATGGVGSATAPTPSTTTPSTTFFYVTQNTNGCESTPRTAITVAVKVTSTAVAGFNFVRDTVCLNGLNPSPSYDLGFTTGGAFTSTPAGLSINAATGDINLAASTAGTYSINYTYNTTGCVNGNNASDVITLNPAINTELRFSYNSPVCKDAAPVLPQTLAGFTTGGTFTSIPGGLNINASTGEINVSNSAVGNYTIIYNITEQGCRQAGSRSSGINIIDTTSPVTKFTYSSTDICIIAGAVNPTISKSAGFTTGGTFSVSPAGLNVNNTTGDINIGLSVPGTYVIRYSVPSLLCRKAGSDSVVFKLRSYGTPVTGFSYVGPVCKGDTNAVPVPVANFTEGGSYSALTAGLVINSTTGIIDLLQSTPGDHIIKYDVTQGVCNPAGSGQATIKVLAQPAPPSVTSASVCGAGDVTLNASALGSISWYTEPQLTNQVFIGSSFQTTINSTTVYYVTNKIGACESEAAIANAVAYPIPAKPYLGRDTSICPDEKLVLNAGAYNSYLWQDGSTNATYNVTSTGIYKVIVSTGIGCSDSAAISITILDDCNDIVFPNAFAPNGYNRTFGALGNMLPVSKYALHIYNRYGQEVFATSDPLKRWDGTFQGKPVNIGAYVYIATYLYKNKFERIKKGTVTVVR